MKKIISITIAMIILITTICLTSCIGLEEREQFSIDSEGNLIITYPDGTTQNLGIVRGKDGINGTNGKDGIDGANGKDGTNGINGTNGVDGKGINTIVINDSGELVITYSDGTSQNMGKLTDEMIWIKKDDTITVNTDRLEIRTAPNENATIIGIVTKGSYLKRTYTNCKWSEVIINEQIYYVQNKYIKVDTVIESGPNPENGWGEIV